MMTRTVTAAALIAAAALPVDRAACQLAAGVSAVPETAIRTLPDTPFFPGEELLYRVRSSRFGGIGEAIMRVAGPDSLRGREAFVLSFDFSARILLFKVSDRTRSWFDPRAASSLRYTKRERSPLSDRDEEVEIYPDEGRWVENGAGGELATAAPLDELSFLYYLRMLPLEDGDVYRIARHFDSDRNPVVVSVVGRESRRQAAGSPLDGTYDVVVVDMEVPDSRQEGGTSRIRLFLTDDEARVPVRLETSMPVGGTMVLELKARTIASTQGS